MKQVPLLETALGKVGSTNPMLRQFVYAAGAQESGFNPTAVGPKTKSGDKAQGMLQVMPATFRGLQKQYPHLLKDIKNPEDLVVAGVLYAQEALKFAKNDPKIAGAYFYGGPSGARKALKGIAVSDPVNKGFPNTLEYGDKIAQRMGVGKAQQMPATGSTAASVPVVGTQVPQQAMNAPMPVNGPMQSVPPVQLYSTQVNDRLVELNRLLGSAPQQQPMEQAVPEQQAVSAPSNFMSMFGFNQPPTVSELRSFGLF